MNQLSLYGLFGLLLLNSCVFEDKDNEYKPLVDPLPATCIGKNFSVLLPGIYSHFLAETSTHEYVLAGKHIVVLDSIGQQIQYKELNALASTSSTLGGYWMITPANKLIRIDESLMEQIQVELNFPNLDKHVISMAATEQGGVIISAYEYLSGRGFIQKRDHNGLLQWQTETGKYFSNYKILALATGKSFVVLHKNQANYGQILTKLNEEGLEVAQFIIPTIPPDFGSLNDFLKATQDGGIIFTTRHSVYKLSASLEMEWSNTNCCNATAINQTPDGDYILAGADYAGNIKVEKIDKQGKKIWSKNIENLALPVVYSIYSTQDGNYIILSTVVNKYNGTGAFRDVDTSNKTGFVLKIDQGGNYCQ